MTLMVIWVNKVAKATVKIMQREIFRKREQQKKIHVLARFQSRKTDISNSNLFSLIH